MISEEEIIKKWTEIVKKYTSASVIIDMGLWAIELVRWVEETIKDDENGQEK